MRAFVALDLSDEVRAAITALQARLPVGRAVPEENLHLTLAFLDDQSVQALEALHHALEAEVLPAVDLRLGGLDLWGGRVPRLLCLLAEPNPALVRLHASVQRAARRAGITLERRRFRPHVTLARFRPGMGPGDVARLQGYLAAEGDARLPACSARRVCLYESVLKPERAQHHLLADYPLADLANDRG